MTSSRHLQELLQASLNTRCLERREIVLLHPEKNRPFMVSLELGYVLHHCKAEKFLLYLHEYRRLYVLIQTTIHTLVYT